MQGCGSLLTPSPAGAWKEKAWDLVSVKTVNAVNTFKTTKAVYLKIDGFFNIQSKLHSSRSETGNDLSTGKDEGMDKGKKRKTKYQPSSALQASTLFDFIE